MRRITVFLTIVAAALAAITVEASGPQGRIIGGKEVDIVKHPYLVSIRYKINESSAYLHKCAGTIYSERVVITAAQCVTEIGKDDRVMIVAGANTRTGADGMQYPALKWFSHPNYSFWTADYDVGIIIVNEPFNLEHLMMSSISIREQRPSVGKVGTIAGWGYREEHGPSASTLEETQVPIVSTAQCIEIYGAGEVTDRMICAGLVVSGGKDACQGDTGGPLVVEDELVGMVSWGRGCGRPGYPGVYTFVGSLKKWIDDTIAANP